MKHSRILRPVALTLVAAATALLLAACGSSSTTGSSSSTSSGPAASAGAPTSAARSKLAACLKAHGVTLPSRPARARRGPPRGYGGGGGGGFFFGGGGASGGAGAGHGAGRFNNPKFRAALQACGGGRFSQRRFTANKAAVAKFTACVKQHGYDLPAPNFSGKGPIFPATIARNRTFQAAARACAADLRPSAAPPGSGAGGSGSRSGTSSD